MFSTVNHVLLHRDFYYPSPIVLICLKYCLKDITIQFCQPSIHNSPSQISLDAFKERICTIEELVVVIVLLFYVHGKQPKLCQNSQFTLNHTFSGQAKTP